MSRTSVLLGALSGEPVTTSDLYERVGYLELTRIGLVPYPSFRAELDTLAARGLAARDTGQDGSTLWRLADSSAPADPSAPADRSARTDPSTPADPPAHDAPGPG